MNTELRAARAPSLRSTILLTLFPDPMPPATNEPSPAESDADGPGGDDPGPDADEAADSEEAPVSDAVRTARLALQAMLGTGTSSPDEEGPPPDDPTEH